MKEPSVSIQMIIDPTDKNLIGGQNIAGGVIIADCGTLEAKTFNSSTEVLKEFTQQGKITRQTDTTIIHAAAIADIMPVFLKRSFDDDGTRKGFGVLLSGKRKDKEDTLTFELDSLSGNYGKSIEVKTTPEEGDPYVIGSVIATESIGSTGAIESGANGVKAIELSVSPLNKFNNISFKLKDSEGGEIEDPIKSISYIYVTDAAGDEYYIPFSSGISYDKTNGVVKAETGEYNAGSSITIVLSEDCYIDLFKTIYSQQVTSEEIFMKNDELLDECYDFIVTKQASDSRVFDPIKFKIAVAGKLFYNASVDAPEVDGLELIAVEGIDRNSSDRVIIDSINKLLTNVYIDFNGTLENKVYGMQSVGNIDVIKTDAGYDNSISSKSASDQSPVWSTSIYDYVLLLWSINPSSVNFSGKVSKSTEDPENLIDVLVTTAVRNYEYSGSLDPEYINAYGANQFIENINDYDGIPFNVKVINSRSGEVPTSDTFLGTPLISFGAMNIGKGDSISTRKAALEDLCDVDNAKIAFLCPFGYVNNAYITKMVTYGPKIWAFSPIGLYVHKRDVEVVKASKPAISTEYAMIMAPHDKSNSMADWVVDMTLEVAYLSRIMSNASKFCEFAPMLGKENATFAITKPSVIFTKTQREALLDSRIMTLITRNSQNISYLNKNKCSGEDNILSEDQNIRLACKINRDLDTLLEPIIGKYNIEDTRNLVLKTINNYFEQNILNQVYSIDSYKPVCDESNNTADIRANNQLVVDLSVTYLNAIYEVLVYHRALNVASSSEA